MTPTHAVLIDTDLVENVTVLAQPDDMGRALIRRADGREYRVLAENLINAEWGGVARELLALAARTQRQIDSLPLAFPKVAK